MRAKYLHLLLDINKSNSSVLHNNSTLVQKIKYLRVDQATLATSTGQINYN